MNRKLQLKALGMACLGALVWVCAVANGLGLDAADVPKEKPSKQGSVRADWTMFGGTVSRNMVNLEEKGVPTKWDVKTKKNIKWEAKLGSRAYGGPIVSDGRLFVGTNNEAPRNPDVKGDKGVVMCFRLEDGTFLWQAIHDKLEAGRVNDWPREGVCSTPTVEGPFVYYVSNRSEVICARVEGLTDGKNEGVRDEKYQTKTDADIVWRFDLIRNLNVFPHNMSAGCPLIVGDTIYIVTGNGVDAGHLRLPSPDAPSFIALNKHTGKLVWRDSSPGRNIMHGQWSNPVFIQTPKGSQVLFPGGDGWLYSMDPKSGEHLWRFDCNPKDSKYDLGGKGTRSDFIGTPVLWEGKIYIGTGQDPEHNEGIGHMWCIDPDGKGDVSPELAIDNNSPPKTKPNPNSRAVWHFGGASSKEESEETGRDYRFGRTMSTAAVHEGLVYISDLGGLFYCIDAKTGEPLWRHDLEAQVWGSPYWVDGKVFIGNDNGDVHIFEHGRTKKILNKIHMPGGAIRSNPTVVNGVLYIMASSRLFAIKGD